MLYPVCPGQPLGPLLSSTQSCDLRRDNIDHPYPVFHILSSICLHRGSQQRAERRVSYLQYLLRLSTRLQPGLQPRVRCDTIVSAPRGRDRCLRWSVFHDSMTINWCAAPRRLDCVAEFGNTSFEVQDEVLAIIVLDMVYTAIAAAGVGLCFQSYAAISIVSLPIVSIKNECVPSSWISSSLKSVHPMIISPTVECQICSPLSR